MKTKLPAIDGGEPVRKDFLPFFRPSIDDDDIKSVVSTLESGWLTLGPKTRMFEDELRRYLGVGNVVVVSSCSAAMLLALKAMGIGDDEANSSIRFSFGRFTTETEIEEGIQIIADAITQIREVELCH